MIPYKERKRKEGGPQYYPVEGSPSQIRICIETTTLCASLRIQSRIEAFSREIVITRGSQINS
jgi:hypothetical protein